MGRRHDAVPREEQRVVVVWHGWRCQSSEAVSHRAAAQWAGVDRRRHEETRGGARGTEEIGVLISV